MLRGAQIEPLDKCPHRRHRTIACHQIVDGRHLPAQLMPLRLPQPRRPRPGASGTGCSGKSPNSSLSPDTDRLPLRPVTPATQ
jgi:hypothetical protein